jgi:hypothetical protein
MKLFRAGGLTQENRQFKTIAALTLAVLALSAFAPDAMAQATGATGSSIAIPTSGKSIGTIAGNITTSLKGAGVMVTALAYLGALAFGFMGALKWKAYGEQPDRTPLKVPVTYMAIAAILAALPEFLGTGVSTIWGGNATVVTQP